MEEEQLVPTWVDKYRPNTIDDLLLDDSIKETMKEYLKKKTIPNMLLSGRAGIGKSSLAEVLVSSLPNCTYLYINASEENGIDVVRNRIKDFVESVPLDGGLKVVILDEADGLSSNTGGSSAQGALRHIMESELEDTRFILTCNNIDRIIEPIQSRNPVINLKTSKKDIVKRMLQILNKEGIKYTKKDTIQIVEIIKNNYPDIRKTLNHLERCCISGSFKMADYQQNTGAEEVVEYIFNNFESNPFRCRQYWIENESKFAADYLNLASIFFNKLEDADEMLIISDKIYELNIVVDKEITFMAMVLLLQKYRSNI